MEMNQGNAAFAGTNNTYLTVEDLLIRNPAPGSFSCLSARHRAEVAARRVVADGCRGVSFYVVDSGTHVGLEEVVVRRTQYSHEHIAGSGLLVADGAQASMRRALFDRNECSGVDAWTTSGAHRTSLEMEDVVLRETETRTEDSGHARARRRMRCGSSSPRHDSNYRSPLWRHCSRNLLISRRGDE